MNHTATNLVPQNAPPLEHASTLLEVSAELAVLLSWAVLDARKADVYARHELWMLNTFAWMHRIQYATQSGFSSFMDPVEVRYAVKALEFFAQQPGFALEGQAALEKLRAWLERGVA